MFLHRPKKKPPTTLRIEPVTIDAKMKHTKQRVWPLKCAHFHRSLLRPLKFDIFLHLPNVVVLLSAGKCENGHLNFSSVAPIQHKGHSTPVILIEEKSYLDKHALYSRLIRQSFKVLFRRLLWL